MKDGLKISRRKLPHWELGGSVYFITFSSITGALPDEALRIVLETIKYDHNRKYRLYIALAMPDHVHLIIQPLIKEENKCFTLSEILKAIKGISSWRINRLLGKSGQVWMAESYDRIIRSEKDFIEKWNYILINPVKSGLIESTEDWEFVFIPD